MMAPTGHTPEGSTRQAQTQPVRKGRLWLWFIAGFLVVFIGLLVTVTMYSMRPEGDALVTCRLWQYYAIEIPRAMRFSESLGPTTGRSSAVIFTAFHHVLFSVAGGAAMLGIGLIVRAIRNRRRTPRPRSAAQ